MKIETAIRTPQHRDNRVFDYCVQRGFIDTKTWRFTPTEHISGSQQMHPVQFKNKSNYRDHRVPEFIIKIKRFFK